MFKDPQGLPRAFASGPTIASARALADQHLAAYREEKRELEDPLAYAEFTEEVKEIKKENK